MSRVSVTESAWDGAPSQTRLGYRLWHPEHPRALLILIHGFGEHGGRYHLVAQILAERGICVIAPDLPGHGRSAGARGDFGRVADCVRDLKALVERVAVPAAGQSRSVLFGHSFGGLVAAWWALEHHAQVLRLILQSPLFEVGFPVPRWKTVAAALLAATWPSAGLSLGLDAAALSHDPAIVKAYLSDPLVHHRMSARTYHAFVQTRNAVMARAGELHVPVLLLYGTEDRIISIEAAQRWFEHVTCEKRQVVFPNSYHELHHEAVRDELLRAVEAWILNQAGDA